MILILSLIFSFILGYWFEKELRLFPFKINKQVFQEYKELSDTKVHFYAFLKQSKLQYKLVAWCKLLYFLIPFIFIVFKNENIFIIFIFVTLVYLSFLDIQYFLTDIKYIVFIFICSLISLLFFKSYSIQENIFSLLFSLILFSAIHFVSHFIKKEIWGMGDSLLVIALSPLFNLDQLMRLLVYASFWGLFFTSGYFFIKKCKIQRLPFIPFLCLSAFLLFC